MEVGEKVYLTPIGSFNDHKNDTTAHVTESEKATWNNATLVEDSTTNGNIKINGTESTVYTHPEYTSSESGLYKVKIDDKGHVSETTEVTKEDITSLGVGVEAIPITKAEYDALSEEEKLNNDYLITDKTIIGAEDASQLYYTNTTSGLNARNVQDAIDEVNSGLSNKVNNTDSRLTDARPASDVKDWAKAENKPSYTASEVGALANTVTHLSGDIATTEKGANNGVATLGSDGKIPSSQLPSYVDDVLEYNNKASFPTEGESGKIYIDKATNITYRWSGSSYVAIGSDLALGETSSTAYAGDKGKAVTDAFNTHKDDTDIHITSTERSTWNAKGSYSKPSGGIPKTDLASSVQTSLGKADSALQSHQDISGKQDKEDNVLNTNDKTIVGAINELYSKSNNAFEKLTRAEYNALPEEDKLKNSYIITDESFVGTADIITYNNTGTGLSSNTVQGAINELNDNLANIGNYTLLGEVTTASGDTSKAVTYNSSGYDWLYIIVKKSDEPYGQSFLVNKNLVVWEIVDFGTSNDTNYRMGAMLSYGSTEAKIVRFTRGNGWTTGQFKLSVYGVNF